MRTEPLNGKVCVKTGYQQEATFGDSSNESDHGQVNGGNLTVQVNNPRVDLACALGKVDLMSRTSRSFGYERAVPIALSGWFCAFRRDSGVFVLNSETVLYLYACHQDLHEVL